MLLSSARFEHTRFILGHVILHAEWSCRNFDKTLSQNLDSKKIKICEIATGKNCESDYVKKISLILI